VVSQPKKDYYLYFVKDRAGKKSPREDGENRCGGKDAVFGDEDLAFDLHLEKFGVDIAAFKEPAVQRIFRAFVEDWEQEDRKKNDCVAEARLLAKYRGLVFVDPVTEKTFSVYEKNMEF
jgi:hypothetical protein